MRSNFATKNPAVIHYAGAEKPWHFRASVARKRDYFRFRRFTAWRFAEPDLSALVHRLEYKLDRALTALGVDYLYVLRRARRVAARLAGILGLALPAWAALGRNWQWPRRTPVTPTAPDGTP